MSYLNMQDEALMPVVMELNTLLADYHIYYQKLRNFHWNILGKNFFDLHQQFEIMYGDARIKIDEIAERILTLRYHPMTRLSDYIETSSIQEVSLVMTDTKMVEEVLKDHKILLSQMTNVIDKANIASDEGTIDLIGSYIRVLEKTSWMLDAWTKKTSEKLNVDIVAS